MRIVSMTATFGKLDGQTLEFHGGMNVICAPNEWGKSTWCAFLTAMLYGVDTRQRTSQGHLAEKERYQCWSGKPMEGSVRLIHQGRDITIQRRTRGRVPMGDFSAWETGTGVAIPELTAANCGEMLLGVERSVFQRTGFVRFADLPVEPDEALRRRLHSLVTTGDETGRADLLARKLKELKNRCRYNRSGLIPEAREQIGQLEEQQRQRRSLREQCRNLEQSIQRTERELDRLELHRSTMAYYQSREDRMRLEAAAQTAREAQERWERLQAQCREIPAREELLAKLGHAQRTVDRLEQREEIPRKSRLVRWLWVLTAALLAAAGLCLWQGWQTGLYLSGVGLAAALAGAVVLTWRQCREVRRVRDGESQRERQLAELENAMDQWQHQLGLWEDADRARSAAEQSRLQLQALLAMTRNAAKPQERDSLTLSREETMDRIAQATQRLREHRVSLGQCQGRMEQFPEEELLSLRLTQARERLAKLEQTYLALDYAQKALEAALQELQRRFAPGITRRAQAHLQALTDGRYDRISIGDGLDLTAARAEETTLRRAQWRSDGTADQMYLALRLAVWEELMPSGPLVLDDALVRFDRERFERTMELLGQLSQNHQILIFSCQERERDWVECR